MNFKRHLDLEGQHAFLGASTFHWINYDEEKLIDRTLLSEKELKWLNNWQAEAK